MGRAWILDIVKSFHWKLQRNLFSIVTNSQVRAAILHNFSIRRFYCMPMCISYSIREFCDRGIRTNPPISSLPLLCCRAWMSQTGLGLNWAEEFQHLAYIYSLRSFGCSWWFPVDPQRLNCSGFWVLSALDSEGVVLWRLTATAGPVCQNPYVTTHTQS